jgi:hypothetical protein
MHRHQAGLGCLTGFRLLDGRAQRLQGHSGSSLAWIPGTRQDWAWDTSGTIYRN